MENQTLTKYLGKDLRQIIAKLEVVQRTSKEGNPYCAIEMTFINGYQKLMFIQSAEQFAWTNAIEMIDTNKQIDANF